ncbi:hypothetical protein [uncultured Microbacterium sp.]|uniref:hypothetical protein n=1 Tax=uncultured Microbacterium sp. TaxID=191216 RepID=UPI0025F15642|nr:hypothetical protein [uncultured Microbacterium sp.]
MRRASVGTRALPLNGIVVGLGFLLPWIAVAGVVLAVVWGVRPLVRRRRAERES